MGGGFKLELVSLLARLACLLACTVGLLACSLGLLACSFGLCASLLPRFLAYSLARSRKDGVEVTRFACGDELELACSMLEGGSALARLFHT